MARYRKNRMSLYEAMTRSRHKGSYGKLLEKLRGSKHVAGRIEPAAAHRVEPASTQRGEHPQKTEPSGHSTGRLPVGVPAEPGQESDATLRSSEAPSLRSTRTEKAGLSGVAQAKSDIAMPKMTTTWLRRPRTVQFNTGRVEFSLSYPVAIAIVMGLVLLFLLVFRAGQYYSFLSKQPAGDNHTTAEPAVAQRKEAGGVSQNLSAESTADKSPVETKVESVGTPPAVVTEGPATLKVGNVIVIVEYSKRADLVPVQKHFTQAGIETEIANWSGKYFLITKDRYEGFGPGSDGYQAKQKIVEAGAKYKAPQGYETFAPLFFKDAYGRKIE